MPQRDCEDAGKEEGLMRLAGRLLLSGGEHLSCCFGQYSAHAIFSRAALLLSRSEINRRTQSAECCA